MSFVCFDILQGTAIVCLIGLDQQTKAMPIVCSDAYVLKLYMKWGLDSDCSTKKELFTPAKMLPCF